MINVTKSYLPDFDKYINTLKRAWDRAWITNNGELVQELELKLKEYLGVKHLLFCTNGTIVLQMALKAYNITGEVITTPFSYVATANSILWEGCTPIFADIEPNTFCIDSDKIEELITHRTQAILATHVYGYPCAIEKIESLAAKYRLKVIYDGAHAFGCMYRGKSLLSYGDISTCSFHATKVFHTVEGGCIITNDDAIADKLFLFRQFGHIYDDYFSVGINGKNSEFHAAMGLCVFDEFETIVKKRKQLVKHYDALICNMPLQRPRFSGKDFEYNYSYYPIIFDSEQKLIEAKQRLSLVSVTPRRYFYPSLNKLPFIKGLECIASEDISKRVLCLPLYFDLKFNEIEMIVKEIKKVL